MPPRRSPAEFSLYWRAHDPIPSSPPGGRPVNAEFNWWLLIVGLVLGAALTWLVMAESKRRDEDVTERDRRGEALWIASILTESGRPTDGDRVEEILRLHGDYLAAPPPDEPVVTPAEPLARADEDPEIAATEPRASPALDGPSPREG
jgi:hypothetical protein